MSSDTKTYLFYSQYCLELNRTVLILHDDSMLGKVLRQ